MTGITGVALIVGLPLGNDKGRLAGYYLYNAVAMPFVALLAHISSNIVSPVPCSSGVTSADANPISFLGWLHKENHRRGLVPDRILRWQHHRTASLPATRRTALHPRCDYHPLLPGMSPDSLAFSLLLNVLLIILHNRACVCWTSCSSTATAACRIRRKRPCAQSRVT